VDTEFLSILAIVVGILAGGFSIIFVVLNYIYNKRKDNFTLAKNKETELAENLESKLRQKLADSVKEDMRDHVDNEITYVKREIASAVSLISKDIQSIGRDIERLRKEVDFLNQFSWGTNTKSEAAYLRGESETMLHNLEEGSGIFRDTEEEARDRAKRNCRKKNNNH
jgi:hypothetical protein